MKKFFLAFAFVAATSACGGDAQQIPEGTEVTVEQRDGVTVTGRLVEVEEEHVVLAGPDGVQRRVPRARIRELRAAAPQPEAPPPHAAPATGANGTDRRVGTSGVSAPAPAFREVTLPAGTVLPLTLRTSVASDTSQVEDPVRAALRRPVVIDGVEALPAGTVVTGHVTNARQAARVKGRGQVALRFTRLDLPGEGGVMTVRTNTVARVAPGTKKRDAATIGAGAVGGAIIGGIVGGGEGAAKGAAIGGAGGTAAVMATRGKEARLAAGTPLTVRLAAPLSVRVPAR